MAVKKGCKAGHKNCDCKMMCCQIDADRVASIQEAARSGTNWAEALSYGPACTCGHLTKEKCYRHE